MTFVHESAKFFMVSALVIFSEFDEFLQVIHNNNDATEFEQEVVGLEALSDVREKDTQPIRKLLNILSIENVKKLKKREKVNEHNVNDESINAITPRWLFGLPQAVSFKHLKRNAKHFTMIEHY